MESDLEIAERLARSAGDLLLDLRDSYGNLDDVDPGCIRELRDRADRESNELITGELRRRRPLDAILSEEDKDSGERDTADRVWIIDPLDGTSEYGQGRTDFAVHIALWERSHGPQGALSVGVVDLPARRRCGTSADNVEADLAYRQGQPMRLIVSRTRPPRLAADLNAFAEGLRMAGIDVPAIELIRFGSVGAKVGEVLLGNADVYLHDSGFHEWDVAAPLRVATHCGLAGGHIDGTDVMFNRRPPWVKDLVVGDPALVAAIREVAGA